MKYLSNFRKIVNRCIQNGWLLRNPFTGFKMTKREVERQALTQEQLDAISNKTWLTINEAARKIIQNKIGEIKEKINQINDIWLR
jgi:hypothetical protein